MRVVITGGAGFIGSNLARRLDSRGDEVVIVDDLSTGDIQNLTGLTVRQYLGSILDRQLLSQAFSEADAVVHLAARPSVARSIEDPWATNEVNVTGTVNVLEALRESSCEYLIYASSSSVYGTNKARLKSESLMPAPISPYAVSKLAGESYVLSYRQCFALETLVFRFFNVYGPLQPANHAYAAVIPAFISAALNGAPLRINGDGRQTRDFTYVGTVVDAIVGAIDRRLSSDTPVNLAFGTETSLLELVEALGQVLDAELPVEHFPARVGDVLNSRADNAKLRTLFPELEPVAIRCGLAKTVTWFRSLTA